MQWVRRCGRITRVASVVLIESIAARVRAQDGSRSPALERMNNRAEIQSSFLTGLVRSG